MLVMGAGKIALVGALMVMLVMTVLVGLLCGVGSFILNLVFHRIIEEKIGEVRLI